MKKNHIFIIMIVAMLLHTLSACLSQDDAKVDKENKKDEIVVKGLPAKSVVLIGTKEQAEGTKKDMEELIDPAEDIAINAWELYKKGNYSEAEKEALKAIGLSKHGIVKHTAHNTLLNIYEATNNYKLAIQEINWLLQHVNEYAKPDLLKKKAGFEQLLSKE